MEIHKKLEPAIVAYLMQYQADDLTTWPDSMRNSANQFRIYAGESDNLKDGQAILVIAEDSNEETPQYTGNFMIPIQIWLRTPTKVLTASETAALKKKAIENHDAAASLLSDALNQDPFLLAGYFNSSGSDFTIMGGIMGLKPERFEAPNFFASGWSFQVYAMNKTAP